MSALTIITQPTALPVSVAELKNYVRLDSDITNDDALLGSFLAAARDHGEMLTGRTFITTHFRLRLDGFALRGLGAGGGCNVIELERGPVQQIDAIHYLDMQGVQQTLDPTTIAQDLESLPARISPKFGQVWPIPVPQIGAVWIDYTAGYGDDSTKVPEVIRTWIFARASTINSHRDMVEIVARGKLEALPYVDTMLDSVTVPTV